MWLGPLVGLPPGRRPLVLDGFMSTRALSSGLSHILGSFVTAVYVEWVVITVTKHFDDLFRTGVSQFPLFSREGYAGLFAFSVLFVTLMKPIHFRPVAI